MRFGEMINTSKEWPKHLLKPQQSLVDRYVYVTLHILVAPSYEKTAVERSNARFSAIARCLKSNYLIDSKRLLLKSHEIRPRDFYFKGKRPQK